MERVDLAGIVTDLADEMSALEAIMNRLSSPRAEGHVPLSVVSANLDHIAQFGRGGRWEGTLGDSLHPTISPTSPVGSRGGPAVMEWLTLLDGAPLVAKANKLTGKSWPRLAGSDIIGPLLDLAERNGVRVGFLGGAPTIQTQLKEALATERPNLVVAGMWAPERAELADPVRSRAIANQVRESDTELLVVGLGKPRQELWMAEYGALTGASVLLAFGAVVDFLAGAVKRAPRWAADNGVEWAWRLALEPRRLARRYLVDDPPAFLELRKHSHAIPAHIQPTEPKHVPQVTSVPEPNSATFLPVFEDADVAVLIVTYNSEDSLQGLLDSLAEQSSDVRMKVIVADNDSTDSSLEIASAFPGVHAFHTGGNLGYSAGINQARRAAGHARSYLILNPDMLVQPGAVSALYQRLMQTPAGIVVPRLTDEDGSILRSLRREPVLTRIAGDAVLGDHKPNRPGWLSETEHLAEAYSYAHRVDWATGAALLISRDTSDELGDWDERFFLYSEETDYFRRARDRGIEVWYEPASIMIHTGSGSGSSPQLDALLAVNKVRYSRKHYSPRYAATVRNVILAGETVRSQQPGRRAAAQALADEARWDTLLGPEPTNSLPATSTFPSGSIIIPAHNEAAVIGRTLSQVAPLTDVGVEVIVAANGCTDETVAIASQYNVIVLDIPTPSKTNALNVADGVATLWPRLYLDADIQISATAIRLLFERLSRGDVLGARPAFRYDTSGAEPIVRSFYRARRRIPASSRGLWGAGAYALSERGHDRLGSFPNIIADDLYVDQLFDRSEIAFVSSPPVEVTTPKTLEGLQAILSRTYRGQAQLASNHKNGLDHGGGTARTVRELIRTIRGPKSLLDAGIYAALVVQGRLRARGAQVTWERDESSRQSIPVSDTKVA